MGEREGQPELDLGHRGAGDDCMAQMVKYGGGAAVAGTKTGWALIRYSLQGLSLSTLNSCKGRSGLFSV